MKEFAIWGITATYFVYSGRPVSRLYFTLGWALPLPKPAHCRNRCKVPGMDNLTLALKMKRLAAWLDRAWQPAGFVSKQYDGAPFGRCYVTIDPDRQAQYASANWNRVHLCGAEPGLRPEGLTRLIDEFIAAGVKRFFIWLSPGPDMDAVRGWLGEAGFVPRDAMDALPDAHPRIRSSRRRSRPISWCGRRGAATSPRLTRRSAT